MGFERAALQKAGCSDLLEALPEVDSALECRLDESSSARPYVSERERAFANPRCKEELVWYLAQRTGVVLKDCTPEELSQQIHRRSIDELASMRAGAYFVLLDEFSKRSDVYKHLTETNVAIWAGCFRTRTEKHKMKHVSINSAP